jgi:hypothetical protein
MIKVKIIILTQIILTFSQRLNSDNLDKINCFGD